MSFSHADQHSISLNNSLPHSPRDHALHPRVAEVREDSVNLDSPVRSPYRSATRPVLQDHIDELDREVHNSFIRAERAKRPPHSPQEFRLAPVAAESVAHLPPLPVAIDKTTKPGIDANELSHG